MQINHSFWSSALPPFEAGASEPSNADGRVYRVGFTATDGFESCTGSVTVVVPHSRKSVAVDSSQTVDSLQP